MTHLLFLLTAFTGSALLFAIQPIVVRLLLPSLGGSPAAWNTAMVFFQLLLLAGYLFAHGSLRRFRLVRHRWIYAVVVIAPVVVLPVALPHGWTPSATGNPTLWTLAALTVMVGGPYFALATVSPTLQYWYTHAHGARREPWMLYAAGNAGSVLALLGYPVLIEPLMGLGAQARSWAWVYGAFVLMLAACSARIGDAPPAKAETSARVEGRHKLMWVAWAAIPSMLLLGVTRHIGDEIASFPLLWILPLTLYLATFIVTFSGAGANAASVAARIARLLVIPGALSLFRVPVPLALLVVLHLVLFTSLCLVLHQRLYASRPEASRLTQFYVYLSLGGALGGMFVVLVAPVIFDAIYEYPLAIALGLLALPRDARAPRWLIALRSRALFVRATLALCVALGAAAAWQVSQSDFIASNAPLARLLAGTAGIVAFVVFDRPRQYAIVIAMILVAGVVVRPQGTVVQDRSFFGVLRVQQIGVESTLFHGTTIHGSQRSDMPGIAQGYFHPQGPAGTAIQAVQEQAGPISVGVVGLGVGALAALGRAGDAFVFYEIDPAVERLATDPSLFTYLSDAQADVSVDIGDGRLRLDASGARHDLLIIDAFSSDAIPAHLLTVEAFQLYRKVTGGGPVILHVSNRHLNLAPVVGATATAAGLQSWLWEYDPDLAALGTGARSSRWTALSADPDLGLPGWWEPIPTDRRPWTDDYSNIMGAIELRQ